MKLITAVLWLCLAVAAAQRLDFYEGDICKAENRSLWTCKKLSQCPKAQNALRRRHRGPPMCNFNGADPEPVVCCEPQEVRPPVGTKSKEMCKKYAESVFIDLPIFEDESAIKYDTCAAGEILITNGTNADPREFPHMALVGFGEKSSPQWLCGGSLISERFVLSAAHCTDAGGRVGLARWVRLGEYNVKSTEDDHVGLAQPVDYEIIQRINYPDYKTSSSYHDIALYKLASEVVFNGFIRPICLQTEHQITKTYGIATGWGRTEWGGITSDILQKVNVTITPRTNCSITYRGRPGTKLQNGIKDDRMFCAGDTENGKDTCQGDSGGPVQNRLADPYCMYLQVGITSFGSKCGSSIPAVYTRVSYYVPWIESVVWP